MTIIKEINPDNSYAVTSSYSKGKYGKGRGTLIQIGVLGKDSEATRVYNIKGIARTIKGGGGMGARTGLYETDNQIRRLTPTECERLQGFPDGWTSGVSDTQRYKCLGNAVATNVITEIGKRLLTNDKT